MDVELFSKKARLVDPFKKVRTRKEVDFQWVRSALSPGLPMSFFDNEEVHKSVLMTAECPENYRRTKPGGVKETTVLYHTFFTTKLIPKLDNHRSQEHGEDEGNDTREDSCSFQGRMSTGWTVVNHHPIVNIIMGVSSLYILRADDLEG